MTGKEFANEFDFIAEVNDYMEDKYKDSENPEDIEGAYQAVRGWLELLAKASGVPLDIVLYFAFEKDFCRKETNIIFYSGNETPKVINGISAEDLFNAFAGADEVLGFVSSKAIIYGKGGVECS